MKRILGLDLGTNSIGWALVEIDHNIGIVRIQGLGVRILPMDAGEINDFESIGKIKSTAAQRTDKRGVRRNNERYLLRRDRLHLVLNLLESLPKHYKLEIDFERNGEKCGQFKSYKEPKLAYRQKESNSKKFDFLFIDSYQEMLEDIGSENVKNEKHKRIPYDWTLYYLREKALKEKKTLEEEKKKPLTLEELAWVLLSYNQKRGYEKLEVEDKASKENEIVDELDLQVKNVDGKTDEEGNKYFEVQLDGIDDYSYKEYSKTQMTFKGDLKEITKTSKTDDQGNIDDSKTEYLVTDIYSLSIEDIDYQKEKDKHNYALTYNNGWKETNSKKKFTYKYKNAKNKPFDYIVETAYDEKGNLKPIQGKDRKLREPNFGDDSKDWTLLKKRTEKEALKFNNEQGYKNEDGTIKNFISPKIYNVLKQDAKTGTRTKIIGGMFQTVEREFYREELNQIIKTQKKFHNNLNDRKIFEKCVETLYPINKVHAKNLLDNKEAIQHLLIEDILLFQRPLKTKKSEIGNCKYEIRYWKEALDKKTGKPINLVDEESGEIITKKIPIYHKVVSASHPYFQEFRIWDKLHNLRLIQLEKEENGKLRTNVDVTKDYFKTPDYQKLFDKLNNQKSLNQKQFLDFCKKTFKLKNTKNFVWNFPENEELKGNETRVSFATRFKRCGFSDYAGFLTQEKEIELWHYLYSVNYKERTVNDKKSVRTFMNRFLENSGISNEIEEKIIQDFANYPKFPSRYCAYSEKALKKLLPFLRMGNNGFKGQFDLSAFEPDLERTKFQKSGIKSLKNISEKRRQQLYNALWKNSINKRIEEIVKRLKSVNFDAEVVDFSSVVDNSPKLPFPKGLFNAFKSFEKPEDFTNLDLTKASYLVYGRHSELAQAIHWNSPDEIREKLHQELKQHSLNNPVAEKVILEMMQIVAKIWESYGKKEEGSEDYKKLFDEIHLEVGRDLKKSAKEKEVESRRQNSNRKQNNRIRQVLEEFLSNSEYNANSKSLDHFERLKIVEEGAEHTKNIDKKFFSDKSYSKKDIDDILKKTKITKTDFEKYKLWIEQGYKSPYTNRIIKLTDLFNGIKYNVDHVFPQKAITNNSLSNKVVCETEVNKIKGNQTGREFVNAPKLHKVYCSAHQKKVKIIDDDTYVALVKSQFSGTKKHILLSREIPKGFTNSQMNNARHIARKAMELLSHIVREPGEVEFCSKNVLPVMGRVTSALKRAWKMNEVWGELVAPRFKRMNDLTQSNLFGQEQISKSGHPYFDCNLDKTIREKDESYNIKRIDHRHHALDALIVALCTADHVNYINNINSDSKSDDFGKQKQIEKYRTTLKRKIKFSEKGEDKDGKNWHYMLPGEIRQPNTEISNVETVKSKIYFYKNENSFEKDYKKMILTALQHTLVTFKQNMRVINKTINRYNNSPNKKKFEKQNTKNEQRYNWAIRRSLGKDTFYSKKQLNGEAKILLRTALNEKFDGKKITTIVGTQIQKILENHLKQFDTVKLPFEEWVNYYNALLEKDELEAIVQNQENGFKNTDELIEYLTTNKYNFQKEDYSILNVFVDQITDRDFRNEKAANGKNKYEIIEHPEIAFTAEKIDEMNQSENLRRLNGGKNHPPIRKVKISRGFGKQRPVSEDELSVKSKQYIVNDSGSNLYMGCYESIGLDKNGDKIKERKFQDIGLIDLIETLKKEDDNRHNPLPNMIFDEQDEYNRIFTLSPLDLVYVPTEEEIENPSIVDIGNLTIDQIDRVYKFVDGGGGIANFIPYAVSKPIWRFHNDKKKKEIHKQLSEKGVLNISQNDLIKDEFGFGSQQTKNQNMVDGKTQIKKVCWKLRVDRLGNTIK